MSQDTPLRVLRKSLLAGAREASGVAVVIDVLRAFTSSAVMMHLGAAQIQLVADPEEALALKREKGYLAVGEVGGKKVPGFDLGNSPSAILAAGPSFFAGRTVVQRTSAGVTGAVAAAPGADQLLLSSFVTAAATARYIQSQTPPVGVVSLIGMGRAGLEVTPDDEGCADYIEHLLTGKPYDPVLTLKSIVDDECIQKFLRGDQPHYPPADAIYCLQRDLWNFVLVAEFEEGRLICRRVEVPVG